MYKALFVDFVLLGHYVLNEIKYISPDNTAK